MLGWSNPFTALFRMFNWRSQTLAAATVLDGTRLSAPFISNIAATTPIVLGANGNSTAIIRFNALDGLGVPDVTNAVTVTATNPNARTVSFAATTGTIISRMTTALGESVTVIPGTAGLVHLVATFSGAAAGAAFSVHVRHVNIATAVAVT